MLSSFNGSHLKHLKALKNKKNPYLIITVYGRLIDELSLYLIISTNES